MMKRNGYNAILLIITSRSIHSIGPECIGEYMGVHGADAGLDGTGEVLKGEKGVVR